MIIALTCPSSAELSSAAPPPPPRDSQAECTEYLRSLPLPANIKEVAPLLLRPLNEELARTALQNMKPWSSPGINGMLAEMFLALAYTLVHNDADNSIVGSERNHPTQVGTGAAQAHP